MSASTLLGIGILLMFLDSAGIATPPFSDIVTLRVMLPVAVFVAGIAFILPFAQTAVLAPFPQLAGSASALMAA